MRADFARAAARYDAAAVLAQEVGRRMAERLDYVRLEPRAVADIGCATGDGIVELTRRYPKALPVAVDFALPMLQQVAGRSGFFERLRGRAPRLLNADVRALPLPGTSLDLIWSNLMLHWLEDPRPAFNELRRVLRVGGLLSISLLGPDTLLELRTACRSLGLPPPQRTFFDMHDVGDMLVGAGFADPVMDTERITLTYTSPRGVLRDQRHLGVRNALFGMFVSAGWRDWRRIFAAWPRIEQRLPATFEVIYGHAWKPEPKTTDDGRQIIAFHKQRP